MASTVCDGPGAPGRLALDGCSVAPVVDFASMYRDHADGLMAMLVGLVPRHVAEEIIQDVFAVVWRADRFDPRMGSRRSYLRGIARHKAVDWLRRNSSIAERERRWAMLAERDHAIDDGVCASDQAARVRLALSSLRADRRQAIVLAYFGGMSYRQVAIELDVPEGTIKSRIRDGLQQLRAQLGPITA